MRTVKLKTDTDTGFDDAQALAIRESARYLEDPMLLAWLDRTTGRHSPDVECCQEEGKETWEIYAESRGGILRIEVDDSYIFILREGLSTD